MFYGFNWVLNASGGFRYEVFKEGYRVSWVEEEETKAP